MVFSTVLNLDGLPSVSCSKCGTWQHINCVPDDVRLHLDKIDFLCNECL